MTIALNCVELAVRIAREGEVPLPLMARRMFFFAALPAALALVARLLSSAGIDLQARVVHHEGTQTPLPEAPMRRWRIPLPSPGFDLGALHIATNSPVALGADPRAFADETARFRTRWLRYPMMAVPVLVTALLFRLHQLITYGHWRGEWLLNGFHAWLRTLTGVAIYSFGLLVVYAVVLRIVVELVCLFARRASVRYALEALAATAYYGAVAAVLFFRLG